MHAPAVSPACLPRCVLAVSALAIGAAVPGALCVRAAAQNPAPVKPVLVELFTSEGCSDCPPADNLLARLDNEQPIAGVHVVVLSEHVTYWNHDGWTDPFSMPEMDERQNDYVAHFHLDQDYTPQAVIDGAEQVVGNDTKGLVQAVEHEATLPSQPLTITQADLIKGSVHFTVQAPDGHGAHLYAALAQDVSHSEVTRGENAGRTLHHVAVVRDMKEFRSNFADGRELSLRADNLDHHAGAGAMRLVVFLADDHSGRVVGAAEQLLAK
jgi:hypothetical protein